MECLNSNTLDSMLIAWTLCGLRWNDGFGVLLEPTFEQENEMLTLTGKEIKDLAEAVGLVIMPHDYTDELETEMTIIACPSSGVEDDDGNATHYKHVAYLSEYPEEGTFPLGDEVTPNAKLGAGPERNGWIGRKLVKND